MLIERRSIINFRPLAKSLAESLELTRPDPTFAEWLEAICPPPIIPVRTAFRWMKAATRVMCFLLGLNPREVPTSLKIEGRDFSISDVLTRPEADCTDAMLQFREAFNTFMADKTLAEAAASVVAGEDEDSRITRASNGKIKGGKGGDRRDYAKFVATHFKVMNTIFQKWDKFITNDPAQYAKMVEAMRATILGGPFQGRHKDLNPMPESVAKLLASILKERLSKK